MATSNIDCKSLVLSMRNRKVPLEPWESELRQYLDSICSSSPCPITMEAAISFQVEMRKLRLIGRSIKVINRRLRSNTDSSSSSSTSEEEDEGSYISEDGPSNLSRSQRRYLLKSMELTLSKSQQAHEYFIRAVREEVTPSSQSPISRNAQGVPQADPYFHDLLMQWYTEKAREGAEILFAQWNDPVIHSPEILGITDQQKHVKLISLRTTASPSRRVSLTAAPSVVAPVAEETPEQYEKMRSSMRSPPVFSDDESGSDKAASGDEFATDDEHDLSF